MTFKVYIPARYQSSRLPGKLLLEVAGKTVLAHVIENARHSGATEIVVATDDERIAEVAESLNTLAILTSAEHESGTDRIAEAVMINGERDDQIIVNVQADEPLLPAQVMTQVADILLRNPNSEMASVCEPIKNLDDLTDPNICKVVRDEMQRALYFSRAPIPYCRDRADGDAIENLLQASRRHVGLYAYRVGFLRRYVKLPISSFEHLEKLEQLRALAAGCELIVEDAIAECGIGIDTQSDFIRFCEHVAAN